MEVEADSIPVFHVRKAEDGTPPGDFSSIGEALAQASPNSCIRVHPGVYEEMPLVIEVEDIQLIGETSNGSTVSILSRTLDAVLRLRSRRALIKGLNFVLALPEEVETDGVACIAVDAGGAAVEDCHISGSAGGVLVAPSGPEECPEPTFRGCHITDCKDFAIKVMGGSNPRFEQCQVRNCELIFLHDVIIKLV